MDFGLHGKVALITGANRSIGLAIAIEPGNLANSAGATKRGDIFTPMDEDFHDGFAFKFRSRLRADRVGRPVGAMTACAAPAGADYLKGSIIDIDGGATHSL